MIPAKNLALSQIGAFVYGIMLPFRAASLIATNLSLLLWSILPVSITLVLDYWLITRVQTSIRVWLLHQIMNWGWNPEGLAAGILFVALKLLLIIIGALTFSATAAIVSSPFNDFLAESAEKQTHLVPVRGQSLGIRVRLMSLDIAKSIAAGLALLVSIVLSWVPIINVVSIAAAFLLIAFQYVSFPQTRRGQGLGQGIRFILRNPLSSLGFGMMMSFFFAIPIISCFAIPVAVVGGTLLYARFER